MNKLTGHLRFQLTLVWLKRKNVDEDFEDFVIKYCDWKGIQYVEPKPKEERK